MRRSLPAQTLNAGTYYPKTSIRQKLTMHRSGRYDDYGFIGAITRPYKAKELKELLDKVIREEEQ